MMLCQSLHVGIGLSIGVGGLVAALPLLDNKFDPGEAVRVCSFVAFATGGAGDRRVGAARACLAGCDWAGVVLGEVGFGADSTCGE